MTIDLQHHAPRSLFEELEGFPWLPRMIDKAQVTVAGTAGDYSPFPMPGNRGFLKHFGVLAECFLEQVDASEAIAAWVVAQATSRGEAAKAACRQEQLGPHRNWAFKAIAKILGWLSHHDIGRRSLSVI